MKPNEFIQQFKDSGKHVINMNLLKRANEIKDGDLIKVASGYVKGSANKYHIPATFSDEMVDRHGDVILAQAYNTSQNFEEYFNSNNVMLWAHNHDWSKDQRPIGNIIEPKFTDKRFDGIADFRAASVFQFASEVFELYKIGTLKTFSVGFRAKIISFEPVKEGQDGITFLEVALMEVSAVPIPANPHALAKALKSGHLSEENLEKHFKPFLKWCVGDKCFFIPKSIVHPEDEHAHKSHGCSCESGSAALAEDKTDVISMIKDFLETSTVLKEEKTVPAEVKMLEKQYHCLFCGEVNHIKYADPDGTDEQKAKAKAEGTLVVEKYSDFLGDEELNFDCPSCGVSAKDAEGIALDF